MKKYFFLILMSFLSIQIAQANTLLTINTKNGVIEGITDGYINIFKGIPYAENPFTKENRFKAPIPAKSWTGIKKTTQSFPVPQPPRNDKDEMVGQIGDLTLNVWMPANIQNDTKHPVMVWFPGGAWIREDATESAYDGTTFAKKGIIIVTVNYRVGVDGFMHFDHYPDNRGLLDQILAMKWVKDNIAVFGGDENNITIFGQSAGAGSIAFHLGNPDTKGLYNKAILQSPPIQTISINDANKIAKQFAENLNINPTADEIAKIPFNQLVKNVLLVGNQIHDYEKFGKLSLGGTAFLPVVDSIVIKDNLTENIKNNPNQVPVIIGSTNNEARLYLVPNGEINNITKDVLNDTIKQMGLSNNVFDLYKEEFGDSYGDIYAQIMSDYTFRMPALQIATYIKDQTPVWYYNFAWWSPSFNNQLGAAHFVDVPFTFNTIHSTEENLFVGNNPPDELSEEINNAWVSFAKTGNPNWGTFKDSKNIKIFNSNDKKESPIGLKTNKLWENYKF